MVDLMLSPSGAGILETPLPLSAAVDWSAVCMAQFTGKRQASASPQSQHPLLPGEMLICTMCPCVIGRLIASAA